MNVRPRLAIPRPARAFLALLLALPAAGVNLACAAAVEAGGGSLPALATEVRQVIHGAAGAATSGAGTTGLRWESLGASLGDYASNPGADPLKYESSRIAARRILAHGPTGPQSPDLTSRWLEEAAGRLEAQAAVEPGLREAERRDLALYSLQARFHAARLIAAVHYNLFRRALSLAELYAATQQEQRAVGHWRELVKRAGAHPDAARWNEELQRLEASLRDLESQCCPPGKVHLESPIWQPDRS